MAEKKKKFSSYYDYSLIFIIIFLTAFGMVMIYSSSSFTAQVRLEKAPTFYLFRQAQVALLGLIAMIIVSRIDYHLFIKLAIPTLSAAYLLCILVIVIGKEFNGKRRWISLGRFTLQPSEFAKLAIIIFLAYYITKLGKETDMWQGIFKVSIFTLPLIAIVGVNNLSAGIIILGIVGFMMFIGGKLGTIIVILCIAGISLILAVPAMFSEQIMKLDFLQGYQMMRIKVWLDPEAYASEGGFQVLQGIYAIGSGGLTGKGLGESMQKLGVIPEAQNDMIFTIICEELGMLGALLLVFVFVVLIYRCMLIANSAPDMSGALLVAGVIVHLSIQVILNIAVVTGVVPNTGIILPFISYGGSSILFLMTEMGLVLSVARKIKVEY